MAPTLKISRVIQEENMTMQTVAAALQRVQTVLQRRPETGLHDDAPATACWQGGTHVVTRHANGLQVATDLPQELGGGGNALSPGWLLRASLAACAATRITMQAALEGIELGSLEVTADSRSDTRGLLGMASTDGLPVSAASQALRLQVTIHAPGVDAERLRTLVEQAVRCSPTCATLQKSVPMVLDIVIQEAASA
jgi:uncharacterized OsmC-like protein